MSRAAAKDRSIRSASASIVPVSTMSWRSTKSLTSRARRSASSGDEISACGARRRRESRSGTFSPHCPGSLRAVSSTEAPRALVALRRWNRAGSSSGAWSQSSITSAPPEARCGTLASSISAAWTVQACARAAQIAARWVLPAPPARPGAARRTASSASFRSGHRPARWRGRRGSPRRRAGCRPADRRRADAVSRAAHGSA